ncbi:MAG: hypothetical protein R3258_07090, partial [Acidimicrobiia bacterium]|nr:hypothetical protein [Acidimicrobiia bacterium]
MTARLRLPRILAQAVDDQTSFQVEGSNVAEALDSLFGQKPGLRNHILDEAGAIRPHVSVFVDGVQADLADDVGERTDIRILQAV